MHFRLIRRSHSCLGDADLAAATAAATVTAGSASGVLRGFRGFSVAEAHKGRIEETTGVG